jgi:hypothetical protein
MLDYYNSEGDKLGTDDNKKDKKYLILLDNSDTQKVKDNYYGSWWRRALNWLLSWLFGNDAFLKRDPTKTSEIKGVTFNPLPSAKVREAIRISLERSNKPIVTERTDPTITGSYYRGSGPETTPFVRDPEGGRHEEGGVWGVGPSGDEFALQARPGSLSRLGIDSAAHVNLSELESPIPGGNNSAIRGTWHIHPSGTLEVEQLSRETESSRQSSIGSTVKFNEHSETKISYFEQQPSEEDLRGAQTLEAAAHINYHIVVGARSGYVYFYRSSTSLDKRYFAKFPLSNFLLPRRSGS